MTSDRKFYIESVAEAARKAIVEQGIIEEDARQLTMQQTKKIITFFGGKLKALAKDYEEPSPYIRKTGEDAYTIFYKSEDSFFSMLHELGHAFLALDKGMKIGEELHCVGKEMVDLEAALFARAIAMPRKHFEKVIIDNWCDGKCNVREVAKEYNIEYLEVLARGVDLNIWE